MNYQLDAFLMMPRKVQEMVFDNIVYNNMSESAICELDYIENCCESPIEKIFLYAYSSKYCEYPLEPQVYIESNGNNYRADFVFYSCMLTFLDESKKFNLVIECDGHDFHKLTKSQVSHDNQRDYDLKIAGYDVLHFSGSQIYSDPYKCAKEVYEYIKSKVGD